MKGFISRLSGQVKLIVIGAVLVAVAAAVAVPMVTKAGFGPDRPTKVYKQGVAGFDHVTFNSFTNVPGIGDERKFFNGKYPGAGAYSDPMPEVKDGDVLELQVYVHNGADSALNSAPGQPGVAKNTTVRVDLPEGIKKAQQATAYISADNAQPKTVYDTLDFGAANGGMFEVEYVPGSAHIQGHNINRALPDSIVGAGTKIGNNELNGNVPGCFDKVVYVTLKVKVKMPRYSIEKEVRKSGEKEWKENVNAKAGETVQWIVTFKNTGATKLESVNFIDQVPAGITVVPGTVKLINGNYPNGYVYTANAVQDNGRTINVDIGDYNPGAAGVAYVMYDAKIDPIKADQCSEKKLVNKAFTTPEGFGAIWDDASVTVPGNECEESNPLYSCDLLKISSVNSTRTVKVDDFKFTAKDGATFKHVVINWGDGSAPLLTNNLVGKTNQYAKDGTYQIRATAFFTVDGKEVSATSADCAKTVTFAPGEKPEEPETPSELPNTGAGDVLALFAAVTAAGAIAHRFILGRNS